MCLCSASACICTCYCPAHRTSMHGPQKSPALLCQLNSTYYTILGHATAVVAHGFRSRGSARPRLVRKDIHCLPACLLALFSTPAPLQRHHWRTHLRPPSCWQGHDRSLLLPRQLFCTWRGRRKWLLCVRGGVCVGAACRLRACGLVSDRKFGLSSWACSDST